MAYIVRASPFGEHPGDSTAVTRLSDVEPIEEGVSLDISASICCFLVLIMSLFGIGLSTCLRNRTGKWRLGQEGGKHCVPLLF